VVEQPAAQTTRTGKATFRWNGGDPTIEVRRGEAFVRVQRWTGDAWRTAFTDDSYQDTTERTGRDVWTETVQFGECDPVGRYRIAVTGHADKGAGEEPYRVVSRPFEVAPVNLEAEQPVVDGTIARVKARYPAPAEQSLLALPRIVRTGSARLRVIPPSGDPETVRARPEEGTGAFAATVPAGSTVRLLTLGDGCGNTA
jgi:hypothetical protein